MRCDEIRATVEELDSEAYPEQVRMHLATCIECRVYAHDWSLLRSGFAKMKAEPIPEPTVGFASRLVRAVAPNSPKRESGTEFFERVGRRFVYACLLVTMTLLLILAVPPSGPVRASAPAEVMAAQPEESTVRNGSLFGEETPESGDSTSSNGSSSASGGQK